MVFVVYTLSRHVALTIWLGVWRDAGVGVLRSGAGDGLRQSQRGLGRRRSGEADRGHEEVDPRASYHLSDRDS